MVAVAMIGRGAVGFCVTWCVVAIALRVGFADDARFAIPVLIVSSTAIALLVAARARRKRTPE